MQISNVYLRKNSGIREKISHVQSIIGIKKLKKVRKIAIPEFANFKSTHIWELVNRLHHIKTRNQKGYENHVITLYSVVTWFFFYKFCPIFREFKANLTVT